MTATANCILPCMTPAQRQILDSKLYSITVPPAAAAMIDRDRDLGHKFVMKMLPADLGQYPRAYSGTLWRRTRDGIEVLTAGDIAGREGTPFVALDAGQRVTLNATLEAVWFREAEVAEDVLKALTDLGVSWRTPRSRVPDDHLHPWLEIAFARHGWEVHEIRRTERHRVTRRGVAMHLVDAEIDATVVDPVKANVVLINGMGKGRSYGAGLITYTRN